MAIAEGYLVSLYPEDDLSDPLHKDSTDYQALRTDVHACDMMTVIIRKLEGKRFIGASFMLIFGNGDDGPISDYTANPIGERFYKIAMGV